MAPDINLCDQDGCSEPATHSYVWEWGKSGNVCAKHAPLLQQTAAQLNRTVQITALTDAPVQREERVKLRAEALVLAEELAEAKLRLLDLYRQNTQLTAQVQSLTVRNREAEAQRKDAVVELERRDVRLQALEAENATLADEIGRLRVLLPLPLTPDDGGTQPGVGSPA